MAETASDATNSSDREIVERRLLDAPRELVFQMWTDPQQVVQWWGPIGFTNTIEEMDVRAGGVWRFVMHGPDGTDYPNVLVYEEVSPPELLTFEHGGMPESDDPTFHATVAVDDMMGMTVLTMKSVFESAAARDELVAKYDAVEGGNQTLGRLEAFLSGAMV